MIGGWIKLHRSIQDHWIWQDPRYLKWWLTILISVNYEDKKYMVGMESHICKPGQSFRSIEGWTELFSCTKKTTIKFFDMLKKDNMILSETVGRGNRRKHLLTVVNWDEYQDEETENSTENYTEKETEQETEITPLRKNKKNNKKERIEEEYNKLYVGFVSSFNSIKGSKFRSTDKVRKQFYARLREGFSVDQMLEALRNAMKVKYHIDNKFTYLTPEFFTRSDKIEMYSNQEEKPSQSSKMLDIIKGIQP